MRHLSRTTLAALVLVPALTAHGARADDLAEADRLHARAEEEETRLELSAARADYDACASAAPSGRWAAACRAREQDLSAHAEGAFAPLVELERARRGPQDAAAIDALAEHAATFPDGRVRAEARMLAAEAYLDRLGREDAGLRTLDLITSDASAEPMLARFAARRAVDLLLARGRVAEAAVIAKRAGDAELIAHVRTIVRRKRAHNVAIAFLAVALAGAARDVVRAWRAGVLGARLQRARRHLGGIAAFAAIVGLGGAALSAGFERGHAGPFLRLGAAVGLIALVARAWSAAGSASVKARGVRAALCAWAVLGVAFLVLESSDVRYLEGFGL